MLWPSCDICRKAIGEYSNKGGWRRTTEQANRSDFTNRLSSAWGNASTRVLYIVIITAAAGGRYFPPATAFELATLDLTSGGRC